MLPSRASSPICPNESSHTGLIQDSGNSRTRAHELGILNALNWPGVMLSVYHSRSLRSPQGSHSRSSLVQSVPVASPTTSSFHKPRGRMLADVAA